MFRALNVLLFFGYEGLQRNIKDLTEPHDESSGLAKSAEVTTLISNSSDRRCVETNVREVLPDS